MATKHAARSEGALFLGMVCCLASLAVAEPVAAQTTTTRPVYLRDRGTGIPTSIAGTYVRKGELLVYPFFEYYLDDDYEYSPEELGYADVTDYRGRYRASEGLVFVAYGLTEDLEIEMEAAGISASFDKSLLDPSPAPGRIEESGLGDVEGQLRWRFKQETDSRPELFSYFEFVFPHAKDKVLIGTPGWELKGGMGVTRGARWGTLTARVAIEYDEASTSPIDLGEYAIEYLKRVSRHFRLYAGLEGSSDEVSLITEVQWHINDRAFVKLNNGIGLTSKATDWAPEVGVVISFPTRRMVQ